MVGDGLGPLHHTGSLSSYHVSRVGTVVAAVLDAARPLQEFVAELTEGMMKLDRYLKDAVSSMAKAAEAQRLALEEQTAADARAARVSQDNMLRAIADIVTSHKYVTIAHSHVPLLAGCRSIVVGWA